MDCSCGLVYWSKTWIKDFRSSILKNAQAHNELLDNFLTSQLLKDINGGMSHIGCKSFLLFYTSDGNYSNLR